ncbi:MAG: response regulator [Peptococcaceae bacterium]|nr:response regulator [Peptococcaceae bacterium]
MDDMKNILVVDDSGAIRLMVKHMLNNTNCRVFEASRGEQVVSNLFSGKYTLADMDLVLLDLYLGEVDGFEVLKKIASSHPNLPVIVMSMERRKESILKCIELGAKDYILKPFDREILFSRLNQFHKILSREEIEADTTDLENAVFFETNRAIRANTPFSVLILKVALENKGRNTFYELKEAVQKRLRRIDNVMIYKKCLVLILPMANAAGLETVKGKIRRVFEGMGIAFDGINKKSFVFPDEVNDKELIKGYNTYEITDLILRTLADIFKK